MRKFPSRRDILQMMGMGLGSIPTMLHSRNAWANNAPKRFVILFTQHAPWYDGWKIRLGDVPEDQHWRMPLPSLQSEFSTSLQPLHPFRDRLMVVDGLALLSAEVDSSGLRHELGQARTHRIVYEITGGVPLGMSPSIDQIIASHVSTPQNSLFDIRNRRTPISVNYSGPQQLLPMTTDPLQAYQSFWHLHRRRCRLFRVASTTGKNTQRQCFTVRSDVQKLGRDGRITGRLIAISSTTSVFSGRS